MFKENALGVALILFAITFCAWSMSEIVEKTPAAKKGIESMVLSK